MQYEHFVARYPRAHGSAWFADARRHDLTREAARWAHTLGEHLHDHLTGRGEGEGSIAASLVLHAYAEWNRTSFVDTVRAMHGVRGGDRGIRAMHFHTLSNSVIGMWRPLLAAGSPPTVIDRRRSQALLSLHAAEMVVRRQRNLADGPHEDPADAVLALQSGMLTETDTAIVLLEMLRREPHLVLVPAPPQFESGAPGSNVDLLVLDLAARRVVGVQVKAGIRRSADLQRYRRDGVVLVDGRTDLGNERLSSIRPGSSSKALVPWPGLISSHFLLAANPHAEVFAPWRERIPHLRSALLPAVYGTSSYLHRAVEHLRRRVLDALHADP